MSFLLLEYLCPKGHRTESLEKRSEVMPVIACGARGCILPAARTISAVKQRTVWGTAVTRAKSDPPPAPTALNTIPLAEGMPKSQWRAQRKRVWQERDRAVRKAKGAPL